VLGSLEIDVADVRAQVARIVGRGHELTTGQIPFTPRAKKVLELSLREALALRHNYIGSEHILLGLVREGKGVANRILLDLGADGETIHNAVLATLSGPEPAPEDIPAEEEAVELKSPPLAPEVVAELNRLVAEKHRLIESQQFEEAARLRATEMPLRSAAARLARAWRRHTSEPS
jgi:ATP-dependent Clp protease ATP-binding subunit ClpC